MRLYDSPAIARDKVIWAPALYQLFDRIGDRKITSDWRSVKWMTWKYASQLPSVSNQTDAH